MRTRRGPRLHLLAAVALVPLATGCSVEGSIGGPDAVEQAELERQISDTLAEQVGRAPEEISCPGDLEAEVGTEMECTLTDAGESIAVAVVVTEVDEETERVLFDIEVADTPS